MIRPTITICQVLMMSVECARALGGVEIGRVIASDAHIDTPTIRDLRPLFALPDYMHSKPWRWKFPDLLLSPCCTIEERYGDCDQ